MSITTTEAQQHILNFLKENGGVGVLATADKTGEPHAATIYFSFDDEFTVHFLTKADTRKSKNLKENARAAIAVFEPSTQTTVQITGTVSEVTDATEMNETFGKILRISMSTSESGVPPVSKLKAGNYVVYRLFPTSVRMASFVRPDPGKYEDIFEIA